MEIHQLRYFCAVAQHGTFTRAAEIEHVAQPSLSQQVHKLETELGARLFDRLPRKAKLTVFGRAFLPKAQRILRELEDARTEMMEMSGDERGEVVVGVIPTIAAYLLPRVLSGFCRRHPLVNVRVVEEVTTALLDRLHNGSIDLAIVSLPVTGSDLACYQLFDEQFYAVLPEKHALAGRQRVSLAELNRERFLVLKEGHCFRDSLISACREVHVRPALAFEGGEFATILAMVSVGMGVSAVPSMAVRPHSGCCFVPIADKLSTRTVGVVRLRHHYETHAQRTFLAHVMSICGNGNARAATTRAGKRKR